MTNEIISIIVIIIIYRAIIAQLSVNCYASFIEVSLINGAHIWDLIYIRKREGHAIKKIDQEDPQ